MSPPAAPWQPGQPVQSVQPGLPGLVVAGSGLPALGDQLESLQPLIQAQPAPGPGAPVLQVQPLPVTDVPALPVIPARPAKQDRN
jgi:hypothetical protein